jgi:hypothetical protein
MAGTEEVDQDRTSTIEPSHYVLDLRGPEPVIELSDGRTLHPDDSEWPRPPLALGGAPQARPAPNPLSERRDATQRARFAAVVTIAVLNVFDLITTYVAIALGAHEGNPIVAWFIESHLVILLKAVVCGSLIIGAILASRWERRVTLPGLCMAWAVVGIYSLVVLLNTLNVLSRL